jgi:hypothetical protein
MSPFANTQIKQRRSTVPKTVSIAGSFGMGVTNVNASYTLAIAAGADIVVTADANGVAGNALDFQATADGLAAATFDFATVLTLLDSVLTFGTGGTGGNAWSVSVSAGSGGGEGVNVFEDTVNKTLTIMYEDGVSTVTNVATAVATTTNFTCVGGTGANVLASPGDDLPLTSLSGGTAQEWAEQSGTPVKMHLHFTAAATTGTQGKTAINAVVGKSMTASGGDANAMAGGDAVAKQDLAGGVDAVALGELRGAGGVDGDGSGTFVVTKGGTGTYAISFEAFPEMLFFKPQLQLASAADQFCVSGAWEAAASQTIVIYIWDKSAGAAVDVAINADNRINFEAVFTNYGGL